MKDYMEYIKALESQSAINVLKSRKATPQGYVNLLQELCHLIDIETEVVDGFYKLFSESPGKFRCYDFTDHRWLCIKYQNKNLMLDTF